MMQEYNAESLTILQKRLLRIPPTNELERSDLIVKYIRKWETEKDLIEMS